MGEGRRVSYLEDLKRYIKIHDAPSDALISQPKVEFPKMAYRSLLVPPPDPLANCAKAALKPTLGHLKEPMIC